MSHGTSDEQMVRETRNTARFFTETRHISWVLLVGTLAWGLYGFLAMPQRKDPDIPIRDALAICNWPGASAERIEQLITRRIEEKIAESSKVERITSTTRTGTTLVFFRLQQNVDDVRKEFDDIKLKLDTVSGLPDGAGPIQFVKDFGDTASLMLTVASPRLGETEIAMRAGAIRAALAKVRTRGDAGRTALVYGFPASVATRVVEPDFAAFTRYVEDSGAYTKVERFGGPGFLGLDGETRWDEKRLAGLASSFVLERLKASEFHPDSWRPLTIRDPKDLEARVAEAAGDKYTYRELKDQVDLIKKTLQTVPIVAKVDVAGVLPEVVYLEYSQERLASFGVATGALPDVLRARNITVPGGVLEVGDKNLRLDPSGEFRSEREIGEVLMPLPEGAQQAPYLRDLVDITRGYQSPARFLNYFTARTPDGRWQRTRAVTLSVQMRTGEQIDRFGREVDAALADLKPRLPEDLILARTSDQPLQVKENVDLFMSSLYEAVILVVVVSLIGFWEWRSALLMALSIPITLFMTFGMMHTLGIDLQQISIASLIIALGLLVDDPVVAGDAIKRELAAGHPPLVAAWLGPTKLATAILYATITNIVAYLPFLMIGGDMGKFMYSMPIVIGCSLVASRLVSMTFIPLLGYYLLRPKAEPTVAQRRTQGFAAFYYRIGTWAIDNRKRVFAASLLILVVGGVLGGRLKDQYFPKDLQYLFWVDVWLPEDAPLLATRGAVEQAEAVVHRVMDDYDREHKGERPILQSITTFVGGGGPRFWISASPEQQQTNYAQVLIQVTDKHATGHLVEPLQKALEQGVVGANVDVRELETGAALGVPVSIRISGEDLTTLRRLAAGMKEILLSHPGARRVRDDWGTETFSVGLKIDADRANMAGVTNRDVAASTSTGINGFQVASLRDGDEQIPVVARMKMEERARLSDVQSLYVYSGQGTQKVPLGLVSRLDYGLDTGKLQRRNQFRTITVSAFAAEGVLPSEVLTPLLPRIREFERGLAPGYKLEIGGEYEEQNKGFGDILLVMGTSIVMIFFALVIQFRHAVKPLLVFAAIPYGVVGAIAALWIMDEAFGFMAFLGVASLIGVIVSHVIVLFDFIEERHAEGAPLVEALLDAGIMRLRPVLITVGATVIALFPLAAHGGPLWEPLCYAQIGGLSFATVITLLLVPVLYAIFVMDLKWVRWEPAHAPQPDPHVPHAGPAVAAAS
jgi:multidrug efflux pump subunit AcrB